MGRSVNYLSHAEYVIYFTADWINEHDEEGNCDQFMGELNWSDFKSNLFHEIKGKLKSYNECEKWDGREVLIFMENQLCEIAISEYCGLYSLSIRAKDDEFYGNYDKYKEGLAKNHANMIRRTLEKSLTNVGGTLLNKIGTFSNGESVFELKN